MRLKRRLTMRLKRRRKKEDMSNGSSGKSLVMPETKTPPGMIFGLIILAVVVGFLTIILFRSWDIGFVWSFVAFLVIIGSTTGIYTDTVQGFDAHILLNHLTGIQRTVFQGMNFKLPWEETQHKIDLRVELNEVMKEETYAAKDAQMVVKYVYTIRPDASGPDAGEKVILYASYEPDAIKMAGRAVFSSRLSDYFSDNNGKDLLQKGKITRTLFGHGMLVDFEKDHGVVAEVVLEDVDFDEATQKARDTISKAQSIGEAIDLLMAKTDKDGKPRTPMTQAKAEKTVRQLNIPGIEEIIIDATEAPNFTGFMPGFGSRGGGHK